jgi:hyperosmotically inducible protein
MKKVIGTVIALSGALLVSQATARQQRDDTCASLIREVRHELVLLPRYTLFDWLEFEVQADGKVILRGQVVGLTLKGDAKNVVKRIEGVTTVICQIEMLPLSLNDDRIRRATYRAIYTEDGPLFRYALNVVPSIHIIVKNGKVTLKGVVDNKSDSDFAYIKARSVPGVLDVKNELQCK